MGDMADDIIEGFVDQYTGEYIDGDRPGYPRSIDYRGMANMINRNWGNMTPAERKIESVRKELKLLMRSKFKDGNSEADNNRIVNECRAEINKKYGKGWRERGLSANDPDNQWTEEELKPFQNKKGNKKR